MHFHIGVITLKSCPHLQLVLPYQLQNSRWEGEKAWMQEGKLSVSDLLEKLFFLLRQDKETSDLETCQE